MRSRVVVVASCLLVLRCSFPGLAQPNEGVGAGAPLVTVLEKEELQRHFEGRSREAVEQEVEEGERYRRLMREKLEKRAYAWVLSAEPGSRFEILYRAENWHRLMEFLTEQEALPEVRLAVVSRDGDGGWERGSRRLTAHELAAMKAADEEPPTELFIRYREEESGKIIEAQVEFGLEAAKQTQAMHAAYLRHRELQRTVREILGAGKGMGAKARGRAQRAALEEAEADGRLEVAITGVTEKKGERPLVAAEYEVDEWGNYARVIRLYTEDQVRPVVGADGQGLHLVSEDGLLEAVAYPLARSGDGRSLRRVENPVPGRDLVELRIARGGEADPGRWNVLEFGEGTLLRDRALSRFSLIQAYVEKQRKETAVEKSRLDTFAEPVFAGLNIGGGVAGVGFPMGEAARLFYNAVVSPRLLPEAPNVEEMRELFRLLAAKKAEPELRDKAAEYLTEEDIRRLRKRLESMPDEEVVATMQEVDEADLRGMLRLAQLQGLDARYRLFADILTGAAKVSGEAESGLLKDIFNSVYYAPNGDISIKNLFSAWAGQRGITPLSGVSLEDLAQGRGPAEAWLQFFNVTVDVRSVANSVRGLFYRSRLERDLMKPIPFAPSLTDLAAYEIRLFGYPLLLYYKRGLIKDDYHAYINDYAYGVIGTRIVEHFPAQADLEREIAAGRVVPVGFVYARDGEGELQRTRLVVFAHEIKEGKHAGEWSLLLYGMKAFEQHSEWMEREVERMEMFEAAMSEGAVIERVQVVEEGERPAAEMFEPVIAVGEEAIRERFVPLLSDLMEWNYFERSAELGGQTFEGGLPGVKEQLLQRGVAVERRPLVSVDAFSSSFVYRRWKEGRLEQVQVTSVAGLEAIRRSLRKAAVAEKVEKVRLKALQADGGGVVLKNAALRTENGYEMGPLLADEKGTVFGAGVLAGAEGMTQALDFVNGLPVTERYQVERGHFAGVLVEGSGDGRQSMFLTVEFPMGENARMELIDPISGRREIHVYDWGRLKEQVTEWSITRMERDEAGLEIGTRTFWNAGRVEAPEAGALLEETRTLDVWFRPEEKWVREPHAARVRKGRVDHILGTVSVETYGLFAQPIEVVDDQFVTRNRYDARGRFEGADVFEHGVEPAGEDLLGSLLETEAGAVRFEVERLASEDASRSEGELVVIRSDRLFGVAETNVLDLAMGGRLLEQRRTDPLDKAEPGAGVTERNVFTYDADFYFGRVPVRIETKGMDSSTVLAVTEVLDYSAADGVVTGEVRDYQGAVSTNQWSGRWDIPLRMETEWRTTTNVVGAGGLEMKGETVDRVTGERIATFEGSYDREEEIWKIRHTPWLAFDVAGPVRLENRSPYGRLLAVELEEEARTRFVYSAEGRLLREETFAWSGTDAGYDTPCRIEERLEWEEGIRRSQVKTFVNGMLHDQFGRERDLAGRVVTDGIRTIGEFVMRTELAYEAGGERVVSGVVWHNGQRREERQVRLVRGEAGGEDLLAVDVKPYWGREYTMFQPVRGGLGRITYTVSGTGERHEVREWFPGLEVAREWDVYDGAGRHVATVHLEPWRDEVEGYPIDVERFQVLNEWGDPGGVRERGRIRGSGVMVFEDRGLERTIFDVTMPYATPKVRLDLTGERGSSVQTGNGQSVGAEVVYAADLVEARQVDEDAEEEEWLRVGAVRLNGIFYHPATVTYLNRNGEVQFTESDWLKVGSSYRDAPDTNSVDELLEEFAAEERSEHAFEPGWLVPEQSRGWEELRFSMGAPEEGGEASAVNSEGGLRHVTSVRTLRLSTGGGGRWWLSEVKRWNGWWRENPYLPGRTHSWQAWEVEGYGPSGRDLSRSVVLLDGHGREAVRVIRKQVSESRQGERVIYKLHAPEGGEWEEAVVEGSSGAWELELELPGDLQEADFIYVFADLPDGAEVDALELEDAHGKRTWIRPLGEDKGDAYFWPAASGETLWYPDEAEPERGAELQVAEGLVAGRMVWPVAVDELLRADGWDGSVDKARLHYRADGLGKVAARVSALYALRPWGVEAKSGSGRVFVWTAEEETDGWRRVWSKEESSGKEPRIHGEGESGRIWHRGELLATVKPGSKEFPGGVMTIWGNSGPDGAHPLYALSARDGSFLEYYRRVDLGEEEHVYRVADGFRVPLVEVYQKGWLRDESIPGYLGLGYDYNVRFRNLAGSGLIGGALATVQNRISANVFNAGGNAFLEWTSLSGESRFSRVHYGLLHDARIQTSAIRDLPSTSGAVGARAELPWRRVAGEVEGERPEFEHDELIIQLHRWHVESFPGPGTGLIPTALGTVSERYVETEKEAEIIQLATVLGEYGLARELLGFYRQRSEGGTAKLHDFYDGLTGTAMELDLRSKRARSAGRSSMSQLAVAEASLRLGLATGDASLVVFSRNLLRTLFEEYRPPAEANSRPRGISEEIHRPVGVQGGLAFWPEREVYPVGVNARAYLLLAEWVEEGGGNGGEGWLEEVELWKEELHQWMEQMVFPVAARDGMVPRAIFQVQDVRQGATGLAPERWTSAPDWIWLVRAAVRAGVEQEQVHEWIENLVRVHGVEVEGVWGIDWSQPVVRAACLSPALTAELAAAAGAAGHVAAEKFYLDQLAGMERTNLFPVVRTALAPDRAIPSGQGFVINAMSHGGGWPVGVGGILPLLDKVERVLPQAAFIGSVGAEKAPSSRLDLIVFGVVLVLFYLAVLAVAIFWWRFRGFREKEGASEALGPLVRAETMQLAEERWAKRVLGVQEPEGTKHTRFSNACVEANFLMQLRAIYKLVLEWRRQENGWALDDRRLVEDETDDWLNGLDEFASVAGIYLRHVIKAGAKDGFEREQVVEENEDSNHVWARWVMYLSEFYWALLARLESYENAVTVQDKANLYGEFSRVLTAMGLRQREEAFDARRQFNSPKETGAMDLLVIQKQPASLERVLVEASNKLNIPLRHLMQFVGRYKQFKKRECPDPVHPYAIELAKLLPHFVLMGLGALVWYNHTLGDRAILPYLWSLVVQAVVSWQTILWAVPLLGGMALGAAERFVRIYRFEGSLLHRVKPEFFLDATVTSLFAKRGIGFEEPRAGKLWDPGFYSGAGRALRGLGLLGLGIALLQLDTPSFATFMVVKGLLGLFILTELAAIVLPVASTWISKAVQDYVTRHPPAPHWVRLINRLNITAARPASLVALSLRYHFQPSVLSGDRWSMVQAVVFYFVLGAVFFFFGVFVCLQIFSLWFTEMYLNGSNWKLFFGGLVFWNTMYLLRYGLFVLATGLVSLLVTFPLEVAGGFAGAAWLAWAGLHGEGMGGAVTIGGVCVAAAWLSLLLLRKRRASVEAEAGVKRAAGMQVESSDRSLGVVYMSGDELSHLKLKPEVLMDRWRILRDKFESSGLDLWQSMAEERSEGAWEERFTELYNLEQQHQVTLWHPDQVHVTGEKPRFAIEEGLHLIVKEEKDKQRLLETWQVRRWIVTMMSTAGHAQDTAVTLVDIAVRLRAEGMAPATVFYLIQNKYNDAADNRPVQVNYQSGELALREKLARLLCLLAPGARAYSLHNWTPFGFKAGGLTGMDLVHEESMRLSNMVVLDRNATVHDMDGFVQDLRAAWDDPNVVIVIPGRGTTNTQTAVGQASQLVEEGHRSLLKGLMNGMGGRASEGVGTGWGNILAVAYGRVQRALVDPRTPKMPLTSRMHRGSSFAVRTEGLIGFTPHAVGISEDTWAVSQAMHNLVALGGRVRFLLSRAMWHKVRETWSHAEWLASFPRWSGGYLQMMHDPVMQRVNDFGPLSVFAKEVRANSGRGFLIAPFALANILLLPVAILLDVTPFVEILIVLWNFGFILNQVLTLHGLNVYLEGCGFSRRLAFAGGMLGGAAAGVLGGGWMWVPGGLLLGAAYGGFFIGFHRWLYHRVRDILLFGPQLVLHALGQCMRQTMEFMASGAAPSDARGVNMAFRTWVGPREDKPLEGYPHFINLKTLVWVFGAPSILLNLFALSKLDMLNVLLLLPSLLFSVSLMLGPFLLCPKPGKFIGRWAGTARLLAWGLALAFYLGVSMGFAKGGWYKGLAGVAFGTMVVMVVRRGLRHAGHRFRLRRGMREIAEQARVAGLKESDAGRLAQVLTGVSGSNRAQVQGQLGKAGVAREHWGAIEEAHAAHVTPVLEDARDEEAGTDSRFVRWASAFGRSWVLAMFVLMWFFIVPTPGLLVFAAGEYRLALELSSLMGALGGGVMLAVLGYWLAALLHEFSWRGSAGAGIQDQALEVARRFRAIRSGLSDEQQSSAQALFIDLNTYVDQGSLAYARRTLGQIENLLKLDVESVRPNI